MGGMPITISKDFPNLIAPGRVDKIDTALAREIFSAGSVPDEPAFVIVLIGSVERGANQD